MFVWFLKDHSASLQHDLKLGCIFPNVLLIKLKRIPNTTTLFTTNVLYTDIQAALIFHIYFHVMHWCHARINKVLQDHGICRRFDVSQNNFYFGCVFISLNVLSHRDRMACLLSETTQDLQTCFSKLDLVCHDLSYCDYSFLSWQPPTLNKCLAGFTPL